jgi:chain length determinant protein (polysaccharide antigen chain regulator)
MALPEFMAKLFALSLSSFRVIMSVGDNNVSGRSNDPEQIDLIDLVMQLWRGKMTIVVCVVVAILLAVGYLAVAKEKWTSTAIVTQPDVAQIATYNNALNVLYGSSAPKVTELQTNVIARFSTSFSALAETLDNQQEPEKLTIEQSVKGQQLPLVVSYVSDSPEGAQRQLSEYIQQIDDKVAKELETDLVDNIKLRTTTLKDSLRTQEVVAQEQKNLRIKQIQEALRYAEQAGVTRPQIQQTQDVTQDSMLLLGSDALKSMIEHEATRPLIFSDSYYQTRQNLLDIEALKPDGAELHTYRYVMKPTLPIRRDSPKKSITLVLAALLGGMIGAGVVLGRNALRVYKAKAQ